MDHILKGWNYENRSKAVAMKTAILTLDDGHIGRNIWCDMMWITFERNDNKSVTVRRLNQRHLLLSDVRQDAAV
jgi:hypothetical protein